MQNKLTLLSTPANYTGYRFRSKDKPGKSLAELWDRFKANQQWNGSGHTSQAWQQREQLKQQQDAER